MGNNQSKLYKTPKYEDFQRIRELSRGAFGRVLVVRFKEQPDVELIMKRLPYFDAKDKKAADEEIKMLQKLQAKYCVRYYGSFVYDDDICIIMEYCVGGNLRDLIDSMKDWSEQDRKKRSFKVIFHTLTGLAYLHSQGIVHRDLKPENIFVDKDGTTKMGDFGLAAKMVSKSYIKAAGTKDYTPPEAFEMDKMTFQSDIWSLGIIFVELLTGKHPYEGRTNDKTIHNIKHKRMATLPDNLDGEVKLMIVNMLNQNPSNRPTAQMLLETDVMQIQAKIETKEEKDKEMTLKKSIWNKIRDDLLKHVVGTESQKQQIIKVQEEDCDYIIQKFEDKEDEEGRREVIKYGVIDGFNYALQNNKMNSISRKYSYAFLRISISCDKVDLLIYQKKPFQGLLRLLEHTESLVVDDAIKTIYNILAAATNTTPLTQQHPHFSTIQQYAGIRKIYDLFNSYMSKESKDLSAICIGFLFRSQEIPDKQIRKEIILHLISLLSDSSDWTKKASTSALKYLVQNDVNRIRILKYVNMKKIQQDLKQPVKGTEQQKLTILQKQDSDVLLLASVIKEREDDELRLQIIQSKIVNDIISIFNNRKLNQITIGYSEVFLSLTAPASVAVRLQIQDRKPFSGLVRLLNHSDILIVIEIIKSINNILLAGTSTTLDAKPHPYFSQMQECDGIKKIYSLFRKNIDKSTKDRSAICIGLLFRAQEISNKQMRKEIISHLKTLTNDSDDWTKNTAKWELRYLARNAVNKAEIEAGGFVIPS